MLPPGLDKVQLLSTGAESNESAILLFVQLSH
jgi:4-aminobutyrate aminotransferase-like enzyme